ncbi:MAG: DUF3052 domain-containing protein [Actinobacteria bacterium]|jgi:hypothetical protein|nr:DUF3052 domain-containing protein [Actinomycetota bacterium]NDI08967.1 DUF3052 domain-containing protein [Actinomycetota bacterium]
MNSAQAPAATVERLGITQDQLILEVGFDQSDCDQIIRDAITAKTGNKFLDATSQEVVDAVILWWRDGDGDLVDELVDALTYLTEDGPIWLFTPKVGRPGYVEPSDIQDAAPTAGMSQTTSFSACADWSATRLIARHAGSNKKKSK